MWHRPNRTPLGPLAARGPGVGAMWLVLGKTHILSSTDKLMFLIVIERNGRFVWHRPNRTPLGPLAAHWPGVGAIWPVLGKTRILSRSSYSVERNCRFVWHRPHRTPLDPLAARGHEVGAIWPVLGKTHILSSTDKFNVPIVIERNGCFVWHRPNCTLLDSLAARWPGVGAIGPVLGKTGHR